MKKSIPFALAAAALIVGLVVTQQSDAQVTHPGGGFVPPGKLGGSGAGGGGSGTITGVTAGSGLIGGGSSGTVTVNVGVGSGIAIDADHVAIDQSYTQRRLSGSCSFGQFLTAVGSDGTITCAADAGDITAVNTGGSGGLTGGVTSGAANLSLLTSCSDQQLLKWGSASSSWSCASDANTTYGAGTSISLTGTTFALNEPGASCSAGQYLSAMNATGTGTCTAEVGDIAGITTASTSGLTGGCTSGTCAVSLLTSCGGNQVLAWNSGTSTWTCTTPTTGTVTSSTLTTNTVPKATGAGALGDSSLTDDGTTFKVASTKLTVTEASGNTSIAGTLGVTGATTLGGLLTVNASEIDNAPTSTTGISIVQGHTAQTSTPIGLSYDDTGATATTATDAYGVKINEVATCSGSDCTRQNYGLYVSASGALNGNFALETGSGDVILNSVSGATQIRSTLLVSGAATLAGGEAVTGGSTIDTLTATTSLTSTASTTVGKLMGTVAQETTTSTFNDYALGSTTTWLEFSNATASVLTGIAGGADGRMLYISYTGGGSSMTISNEAAGSVAANRIHGIGNTSNLVSNSGGGLTLIYDGTSSRWRPVMTSSFPTVGTTTLAVSSTSTYGSTMTLNSSNLVVAGADSHIRATGTSAALTSCGTSPTIAAAQGSWSGTLVEGSSASGCTVTFHAAMTSSSPTCTVTSRAGLGFTYTTSATALTITNVGALSSTTLDYICIDH